MSIDFLHSEPDLLLRVSQGDQQAFRRLTYLYSERIFFQVLTFVKSWHQAEEMVQDIFLRIWQKREMLQHVENWDSYLFTLTRNCLINNMKRKGSDIKLGELQEVEDTLRPDDQQERKELVLLLEKAILQLPAQKQAVFRMIHQDGMSQEEVSKHIGIATRTVRWNLVSAINEIRDFLHRYSFDALYWLPFIILQHFLK